MNIAWYLAEACGYIGIRLQHGIMLELGSKSVNLFWHLPKSLKNVGIWFKCGAILALYQNESMLIFGSNTNISYHVVHKTYLTMWFTNTHVGMWLKSEKKYIVGCN